MEVFVLGLATDVPTRLRDGETVHVEHAGGSYDLWVTISKKGLPERTGAEGKMFSTPTRCYGHRVRGLSETVITLPQKLHEEIQKTVEEMPTDEQ